MIIDFVTMQTKRSKSYLKIITTAKKLFWKHGSSRVTIEELCREAGVSKMTFYRHFNNKNEIIGKVLEMEFEKGMQEYRGIMALEISFKEKIHQIVLLKQNMSNGISKELINDLYTKEEVDLLAIIEKHQEISLNEFVKDLRVAQENGWIRKGIKVQFIIYMLNSINEKMKDNNFLDMYENTQDAIMEVTNFFFYGLFSDPK